MHLQGLFSMFKILFYIPTIVLNRVKPCLRLWYKPSTEAQRELSEQMRNEARLVAWRGKKFISQD